MYFICRYKTLQNKSFLYENLRCFTLVWNLSASSLVLDASVLHKSVCFVISFLWNFRWHNVHSFPFEVLLPIDSASLYTPSDKQLLKVESSMGTTKDQVWFPAAIVDWNWWWEKDENGVETKMKVELKGSWSRGSGEHVEFTMTKNHNNKFQKWRGKQWAECCWRVTQSFAKTGLLC